jgi:hypothetical protein
MAVLTVVIVGVACVIVPLALSAFLSSSEIAVFSLSPATPTSRGRTRTTGDVAPALRDHPAGGRREVYYQESGT